MTNYITQLTPFEIKKKPLSYTCLEQDNEASQTKAGVAGLLWLSVTRTAYMNVLGSCSQSPYQTWRGMHVPTTREGVQSTIRAPSRSRLVSSGKLASSQATFAVLCLVSPVRLFATPWSAALQAPPSTGILQARVLQ